MGTRNLTLVKIDGSFKVAQYGQSDGYPSVMGAVVLDFLKQWDRAKFARKVRSCRFMDDDQKSCMNVIIQHQEIGGLFENYWPELQRDTGSNVLGIIERGPQGMILLDNSEFAADGIYCEFGYLIDMDEGVLEFYVDNMRKVSPKPTDPFYSLTQDPKIREKYGEYPIRLAGRYPLDNLPTVDELEKAADKVVTQKC